LNSNLLLARHPFELWLVWQGVPAKLLTAVAAAVASGALLLLQQLQLLY